MAWDAGVNVSEWVVLELSAKAEGEDPDLIRSSIRHMIRDAEVYLPVSVVHMGDDRVVNYLVDGYAFIRRVHPDEKYYRLEGSRYVQSVITKVNRHAGRSVRALACATDADIDRFRSQVYKEEDQGIGVGDIVLITSGPYRQIRATVFEDLPENDAVQIYVKLRSKESLVTLPRSFLRLIEKAPRSGFQVRARALREWLERLRPVVSFEGAALQPIQETFRQYGQLEGWITRGQRLHEAVRVAVGADLSARPLEAALQHSTRLSTWYTQGTHMVRTLQAVAQTLDPQPLQQGVAQYSRLDGWSRRMRRSIDLLTPLPSLQARGVEEAYLKLLWFEDALGRLTEIREGVEEIERSLLNQPLIDNILIDGHNLAIRCALVPGLSDLTDSQGRPTGAILGFLRSLVSLRKRLVCSQITVTWDGSSQRRRALCSAYKANRGHLRSYFEIDFLKALLPLLGITQAWHPQEEADDVLASLVRGPYKGQRNVLVTTDRDLLQVVTATDRVLVPAVGAGKERYYGEQAVEAEYGVAPHRMVQYRALNGDVSDNLPGVPGFGPKMVSKLLRLYGTVDSLFSSSMAGLTPAQHQKLRSAEKQVKLNVSLMTLQDNLAYTTIAPNPDQKAAEALLQQVDMKVDLLSAFFRAL